MKASSFNFKEHELCWGFIVCLHSVMFCSSVLVLCKRCCIARDLTTGLQLVQTIWGAIAAVVPWSIIILSKVCAGVSPK